MDALAKCGTSIIVLINSFFGVLGLLFLVGGCLVKFGSEKIDGLVRDALDKFKDAAPKSLNMDLENFSLKEFVDDAATWFIVIGCLMLFVVFWAYCGACCKSRCMLIIYAVILTIVILGQVTVVVIFVTNRSIFDNAIKKPMKESLQTTYKGERGKDAASVAWNGIMGLMDCCGVDGYADFANSTSWNHTYTVDDSPAPHVYVLEAPVVCCVTPADTCSLLSNADHNTYHKGCYSALWDIIGEHKDIVIGVLSAIGAVEVILWLLVVWIIRGLSKKKNKVKPI